MRSRIPGDLPCEHLALPSVLLGIPVVPWSVMTAPSPLPAADEALITTTLDTVRIYPNRGAKRFLGKWKCPWRGSWQNKAIPADIRTSPQARQWFQQWLRETLSRGNVWAADGQVAIPRPTLRSLVPVWAEHKQALPNADAKAIQLTASCVLRWGSDLLDADAATLRVSAVAAWCTSLWKTSGLAPHTIRNVVQAFRGLVTDARGLGWLDAPTNVFADDYLKQVMPKMQNLAGKDVIVALTEAQAKQLAKQKQGIPEVRQVLNMLALCTGMRVREIAGLSWDQVDARDNVIRVTRQLRETGEVPTFKPPKRNSKRTIPIHPALQKSLEKWRSEGWERWTGKQPTGDCPVFPNSEGRYGFATSARSFREDLVAAGVPARMTTDEGKLVPFTFHSARRTALTLLTDAGVDSNDVKAIAGHAAAGVTAAHYVAKTLPRLRKAIVKLPF
jgi:integrase